MDVTYKSAKIYSGTDWIDLAVATADPAQRTIANITGTTYTPGISDAGKALVFTNSSAITLTIPSESSTNYTIGQTFLVIQKGTGQVTVAGASGVTINALSGNSKTSGQYAEARLIKTASNEWLLSGDLSS